VAIARDVLLADLRSGNDELLALLAPLTEEAWETPTPSPGWAIRDQVSHLAWNDDAARRAMEDAESFVAERPVDLAGIQAMVDAVVAEHRHLAPQRLFSWLEGSRRKLIDAAGTLDPATRIPWFGPDMTVASKLTARIMETWAHTQDVADALGVERTPDRLVRHVVFLGLRALPNAFRIRGLDVPDVPLRLELVAPDGERWELGEPTADQVVAGPALDLALLVTQRRHRDDTALLAHGQVAETWLTIAQAYAGPPGPGRDATTGGS
jgi:uncharacterized protein (TIGR03084 family)